MILNAFLFIFNNQQHIQGWSITLNKQQTRALLACLFRANLQLTDALMGFMMCFLPNILLSGFMFPFAGMPQWAQWIGEALPLTHYLRIVRSIMLKGSSLTDLHYEAIVLFGLMLVAMTIAVTRFRRTLD